MTKIDIFTNHYDPENFRINEIAAGLSKQHSLKVVTQVPNYPKGSFFDGYGWFKKHREVKDNLEILRLPVIPRGSNPIMLIFNYFSYIVSSFFYSVFSKTNPDYVFVYVTSPIFISWAGLRVAKKKQVASTLYLLDLWPGVLFTMLNIKNKYIRRFFEKMTIKIYQRFDRIIVSSYSFIEVLENYGIPKDKLCYIPQHAEAVYERSARPNREGLQIIFTGNIGEAQGLDILIGAAQKLKQNEVEQVYFKIVGEGRYKEAFESKIKANDVDRYFEFTGRVDAKEIPQLLSQADVGFVSLADDETLSRTLPAKVQTYMVHGIPILASANGEIPWILKQSQAGISAPANDAQALYEAIIKYKSMTYDEKEKISQNGYNYAKANFDKDTLIKRIQNVITQGY